MCAGPAPATGPSPDPDFEPGIRSILTGAPPNRKVGQRRAHTTASIFVPSMPPHNHRMQPAVYIPATAIVYSLGRRAMRNLRLVKGAKAETASARCLRRSARHAAFCPSVLRGSTLARSTSAPLQATSFQHIEYAPLSSSRCVRIPTRRIRNSHHTSLWRQVSLWLIHLLLTSAKPQTRDSSGPFLLLITSLTDPYNSLT